MKPFPMNLLNPARTLLLAAALASGSALSAQTKTIPAQPGEFIGRVLLMAGLPVDKAQVLLEGTPLGSPVAADGRFDVRHVPPGRWDIRIEVPGLAPFALAGGANAGQVTDLGVIALPYGEIVGRVQSVAGVPATPCTITLEGGDVSASTDADGVFDLRLAPEGAGVLSIQAGDLAKFRIPVGIVAGQITNAGLITCSAPGAIGGSIQLPDMGSIAAVVVGIPALGIYAQPNASGCYLLNGVAPGSWQVTAFIAGQPHPIGRRISVQPRQLVAGVDLKIVFSNSVAAPPHGAMPMNSVRQP